MTNLARLKKAIQLMSAKEVAEFILANSGQTKQAIIQYLNKEYNPGETFRKKEGLDDRP